MRSAALLGLILGLGLLTKAYFLTAVPAVLLLVVYRYRREWLPAMTVFAVAAAVAGWWYTRNLVTTGTLSGLAEPIMLREKNVAGMIAAVPAIPWGKAVDVILVSHLYFCGWSSLTVRSWMYHLFYAILALVALGLVRQLGRKPVLWLAAVYGAFWLGQLYNVVLQFLTKGLAGSMGWYLNAVVACEVVLCAVAFGRWQVWAVSLGAVLFGLLDLYGMHGLAIPLLHGSDRAQAEWRAGVGAPRRLRAAGFGEVFERLAVNRPAFLSAPTMVALWALYLAATMWLMAAAVDVAFDRKNDR